MGKQVNFWMMEQDEQEFVQHVLSRPDVVVVGDLSPGPYPRVLHELPRPPELFWWSVYFWHQGFPFEPATWVQVREGPRKGMYGFVGEDLPVIEFSRCGMKESGELSEGRIWTGRRDSDFNEWYSTIAGWIRKRYRKVRKVSNIWLYAGPQAYEWHQAGGILGR